MANGNEGKRREKFSFILTVFMQHQWIKTELLHDKLKADKLVTMEKDDLQSDDMKKARAEAEERALQA